MTEQTRGALIVLRTIIALSELEGAEAVSIKTLKDIQSELKTQEGE